jgi:hypothetical protein
VERAGFHRAPPEPAVKTPFPVLVLLALLAPIGLVSAQTAPVRGRLPSEPPRADSPLSLERVKRRVTTLPRSPAGDLRLDYYIEVVGSAPVLNLFDPAELTSSGVPYGGMTHGEMLGLVTPQAFRSPAMNLSNVASAASSLVNRRQQERQERKAAAKRRAEQEALRIHGEKVQ